VESESEKQRVRKHLEQSNERAGKIEKLLTQEADRGCALVGGELLNERLLNLIQARMTSRATVNKFDSFFEGHGPLTTFAARTHLTYLLGFIADTVYQDLCVIRDIRNRFAHSSEDIDFSNDEIKSSCSNLHHYLKQRVSDPRAQFIFAVSAVDMVLEYLIFDSEHATTPANGPEELYEILRNQWELYAARITGIPPA
jgi:DNA-binding MltR family transcriptional regulator